MIKSTSLNISREVLSGESRLHADPSFGSILMGQRGRNFKQASICVVSVLYSSEVSGVLPTTIVKLYLKRLNAASHNAAENKDCTELINLGFMVFKNK